MEVYPKLQESYVLGSLKVSFIVEDWYSNLYLDYGRRSTKLTPPGNQLPIYVPNAWKLLEPPSK